MPWSDKEKQRAYNREYFQRNRNKYLAYQKVYRRRAIPKTRRPNIKQWNREFIIQSKSVPCKDCGIRYDHWIMQFDHRNPAEKLRDISEMARDASEQSLRAEIAKCDVVCANCHADRTYKGKHWLFRREEKEKIQHEPPPDPQLYLPLP